MQALMYGDQKTINETVKNHRDIFYSLKLNPDLTNDIYGQKDCRDYFSMWEQTLQFATYTECSQTFIYCKELDNGDYEFSRSMIPGARKITGELKKERYFFITVPLITKIAPDDEAIINQKFEELTEEKSKKLELLVAEIPILEEQIKNQKVTIEAAKKAVKKAKENAETKAKVDAEANAAQPEKATVKKAAASAANRKVIKKEDRVLRLRRQTAVKLPEEEYLAKLNSELRELRRKLFSLERSIGIAGRDLEEHSVKGKSKFLAKELDKMVFDGKDLLDSFFSEEELEDFSFEVAEGKRVTVKSSSKLTKIEDLSPSLLIQFRRFNSNGTTSKRKNKINFDNLKTIDFNEYVMNPDPSKPLLYKLNGFIVHEGTIDCGHYIAYVKKAGSWYRCSDISSHRIDNEELERELGNAYFCSFQKTKHKAE